MNARSSIATRLYLLIGLLSAIALSIGLYGLHQISATVDGMQKIYEERTVPLREVSRVRRLYIESVGQVFRALQHDPAGRYVGLHDHPVTEHLAAIETNLKRLNDTWTQYRQRPMNDEERAVANVAEQRFKAYEKDVFAPTLAALKQGDYSVETAGRFLRANRTHGQPTDDAMKAIVDFQANAAKADYQAARNRYEQARVIMIVLILAGIAGGILAAVLTIRQLLKTLTEMRDTMQHIQRHGDFTRSAPVTSNDEVGQTAEAFNELLAYLRNSFGTDRKSVV